MKNLLIRLSIVASLVFSLAPHLHAQMPGAGSNPMNTAMLKLFGQHTNFTATSEVNVKDGAGDATELSFSMAMLDGKMRAEMDLANMKNKMLPPEAVTQMKKMGMDRTTYIIRPDKKVSYLVYPGLNSYVQMPITEADSQAMKEAKINITEIGKETIDGHPCVKNKVLVTDDKGKTQEATVWNATDMKNFPIQMQMKEKESTVVMKYKNVQFAKPDAKKFEAPAGMTKYDNMQQLQQVMMQKMMATPGQ